MSEAENGNKADWVNELVTMEGTEKYLLLYLKTTKTEEDDDNIYCKQNAGPVDYMLTLFKPLNKYDKFLYCDIVNSTGGICYER